ncbi:MAG: hypothetical protein H6828_10070 [Planctomycetes bacterium]|nr:hypothetical protein [Planctomycetota bacterium]
MTCRTISVVLALAALGACSDDEPAPAPAAEGLTTLWACDALYEWERPETLDWVAGGGGFELAAWFDEGSESMCCLVRNGSAEPQWCADPSCLPYLCDVSWRRVDGGDWSPVPRGPGVLGCIVSVEVPAGAEVTSRLSSLLAGPPGRSATPRTHSEATFLLPLTLPAWGPLDSDLPTPVPRGEPLEVRVRAPGLHGGKGLGTFPLVRCVLPQPPR